MGDFNTPHLTDCSLDSRSFILGNFQRSPGFSQNNGLVNGYRRNLDLVFSSLKGVIDRSLLPLVSEDAYRRALEISFDCQL